jgi:protein involved in polysaccharide export with SLBB domain
VIQQARIDEYVQNLELQITRGTLALASSPVSSAQDLASGTAAQASGRELITRLRQIRATGRIVLEFKSGTTGTNIVPDLALEDGDRFVVPPIPSTVNVVGAVYDQNSFLYQKTRPSGAYLHLAGGPNREADKKHLFIIRADGSVVSRESANGLWGNTFEQLQMNPGDTIVVPEKGFNVSGLRSFIEWSQLFSQFALGAASLAVIARD